MAISLVGSYAGTHNATGGLSVAFTNLRNAANVQPTLLAGDLVLVSTTIAGTANLADGTMTPTTPTGYNGVFTPNLGANDSHDSNLQISWKIMGATPDTSVTIRGVPATSNSCAFTIHVLRGADTTAPIEVNQGTSGNNTGLPNPPSITPVTAGSWLLCVGGSAMAAGTAPSTTPPTGLDTTTNHFRTAIMTTQTNDAAIAAGLKSDWSSGPFDCPAFGGFNTTNTGSWTGAAVAIKPYDPIKTVDATLAGTGTVSADATIVGTPSTTQYLWTGLPTTDGCMVSVKLNSTGTANSVRMKVSTTSDLLTNPVFSGTASPDATFRIAKLSISSLSANTQYYYAIEIDGTLDTATKGQFKTLPTTVNGFRLAFAGCADGVSQAAFTAMLGLATKPNLFLHIGDFHYGDPGEEVSPVESHWQTDYDTAFSNSTRHQFCREIPHAYMWSDHDFGASNGSGYDTSLVARTWRPTAISAFRRRVPQPQTSSTSTDGVWTSFSVGRLRFILADNRSDRDDNSINDSSSKTMLRAPQKAWFKSEIDTAVSTGQAVIWVSDSPFVDNETGGESWQRYAYERTELVDYIRMMGMTNRVTVLSSDAHSLAHGSADYATGTGCSIVNLAAGPLSQSTSIKGGPWDATYPTSGTAAVQQYGLIDITDNGTDIVLDFKGYSADGTQRVNRTVTMTPAAPVAANGSGAFDASGATVSWNPGDGYKYWKFNSSGTLTVSTAGTVEYLLAAGGGSGGSASTGYSGGGGAGGVLLGSTSLSTGAKTVTIGAGGAGAINGRASGADSTVTDIGTADAGGAGGGNSTAATGVNGGSGGGGYAATAALSAPGTGVSGEGNDGGVAANDGTNATSRAGGGGGGKGAVGGAASVNGVNGVAGVGGIGVEWPTGSGIYWAGGGAGSAPTAGTAADGGRGGGGSSGSNAAIGHGGDAVPNTGSGAGGAGLSGGARRGGNGGSGIFILRAAIPGGPVTYSAASNLSASGTVTANIQIIAPVTSTLSATGTIPTQDLRIIRPIEATLSATGTVSADTGRIMPLATTTLSATGTIPTQDLRIFIPIAATLSGTATTGGDLIKYVPVASTLSASGSVTASALITHIITSTLSATGAVTANADNLAPIQATLSAAGSVNANATVISGSVTYSADATLSAAGSISASLTALNVANANLNATGTVTANADKLVPIASTLNASGTLSANALVYVPAVSTLTSTGTLSASAIVTHLVSATLSGFGATSGDLIKYVPVASNLSGSGTLTSAAVVTHIVDSTLAATGTINADLQKYIPISATLVGTGTVTTTTTATLVNSQTLTASGNVSADITAIRVVQATLVGSGTLDATLEGDTIKTVSANLAGAGGITANADKLVPVAATLSATGNTTANLDKYISLASDLSGAGSINATTTATNLIQATLNGVGSFTGEAENNTLRLVEATLVATGTIVAAADNSKPANATLDGTGNVSATATIIVAAGTLLTGSGSQESTIGLIAPLSSSMNGTGNLNGDVYSLVATQAILGASGNVTGDASGALLIAGSLVGTGTLVGNAYQLGSRRPRRSVFWI